MDTGDGGGWLTAWERAYARTGEDALDRRGRLSVGGGPVRLMVLASALLGLLVAPLAVAGPSSGGSDRASAARTGDVIREGIRNPRRGAAARETQVISGVRGERYGTRQSNISTGSRAGGAAIYGCRRPTRECTRHVNLRDGPAAHFATAGDVPFTIDSNATGMVAGLNAERVGGLTATQLRGQTGPQGATGPRGATGPQGPAGSDATINGVAAGGDLDGTYPDPTIRSGAVGTGKLADGAVTEPKLANLAGSSAGVAAGLFPNRACNSTSALPGARTVTVGPSGMVAVFLRTRMSTADPAEPIEIFLHESDVFPNCPSGARILRGTSTGNPRHETIPGSRDGMTGSPGGFVILHVGAGTRTIGLRYRTHDAGTATPYSIANTSGDPARFSVMGL